MSCGLFTSRYTHSPIQLKHVDCLHTNSKSWPSWFSNSIGTVTPSHAGSFPLWKTWHMDGTIKYSCFMLDSKEHLKSTFLQGNALLFDTSIHNKWWSATSTYAHILYYCNLWQEVLCVLTAKNKYISYETI